MSISVDGRPWKCTEFFPSTHRSHYRKMSPHFPSTRWLINFWKENERQTREMKRGGICPKDCHWCFLFGTYRCCFKNKWFFWFKKNWKLTALSMSRSKVEEEDWGIFWPIHTHQVTCNHGPLILLMDVNHKCLNGRHSEVLLRTNCAFYFPNITKQLKSLSIFKICKN